MSKSNLSKTYEHKEIEPILYRFWKENDFFKASSDTLKPTYSLIMPPPNVTGILHMGHALVNVMQDVLARYKRMLGYEVCWVPGTDHAGIATQSVVERHLRKLTGKKRTDFSREEFVAHIVDWKNRSQETILSQLEILGCSCDWSRLSFTLDNEASFAVKKAFKDFYDRGLIYQGDYLVNWDPVLLTALADDEVEYVEQEGYLYYFNYPISDGSGVITVATTRPETLFGDTAVAVAPEDERYAHLIGKELRVPFVNRLIPVIADHRIDPTFGTGAVKITPAHDKNDYRIAKDHNLGLINILTPEALLNEECGIFRGMSKDESVHLIIEELKKMGLFISKTPYRNRVGVSYRSNAVIEPYLSKQWFVNVKPFIPFLKQVVESGEIELFPKEIKRSYFNWINHLEDWCISRQLWWGHRIPVWYNLENPEEVICFPGEGIPPEAADEPEKWRQDPDVLDTWFSSGLWPLSCLGWPGDSKDLEKFYPTSVLVTGSDILFFWVARMILMCGDLKGIPFKHVFLHGLIYGRSYKKFEDDGSLVYITGAEKYEYDMGLKPVPANVSGKWEKLSKSKGNVIDPLEVIELYGCDALRMTLCACANRGSQIDLDYRLLEEFKNFSNKIWNGARFIFGHIENITIKDLAEGIDEALLDLEDLYILRTLNVLFEDIALGFDEYHFDKVSSLAYNFYRNDLCSNYIEIVKPVLFGKFGSDSLRKNKKKVLSVALIYSLGFMHPITPFITEELFLRLKDILGCTDEAVYSEDSYTVGAVNLLNSSALMTAPYPSRIITDKLDNPIIFTDFAEAMEFVYVLRRIRGEMNIPPQTYIRVYVVSANERLCKYFSLVKALAMVAEIDCIDVLPEKVFYVSGVFNEALIAVVVPDAVREKEKLRLEKEKERLENSIMKLSLLLNNADFLSKADGNLVKEKKNQLEKSEQELTNISQTLTSFF
ncbi:MAG: valine--tRNA ligase [Victivallaceae bacterium]